MRIKALVLALVCGILVGCGAPGPLSGQRAQVQEIISGQTLVILPLEGLRPVPERLRLIGLSAPDRRQYPWGFQAQAQLEKLLTPAPILVELDVQEQDRFGRRLAYVWQDGRLINEALIAAGAALATRRSPNTRYAERFQRAQETARLLERGIWDPEQPLRQTPTEFRQNLR